MSSAPRGLAPREGLELVLMKMGHAGPPLSHAAGRRQASLGTPVPRTPTKIGFKEVKTLTSDVPTILDYKEFNYDICSLVGCIYLLQSMINSPHAYKQNKAFTKHIVDAMMKALEEKLELEVSIPRKLHDVWEPTIKVKIQIMSVLFCVTWVLVFLQFRNLYVMCLVLPILKNAL